MEGMEDTAGTGVEIWELQETRGKLEIGNTSMRSFSFDNLLKFHFIEIYCNILFVGVSG